MKRNNLPKTSGFNCVMKFPNKCSFVKLMQLPNDRGKSFKQLFPKFKVSNWKKFQSNLINQMFNDSDKYKKQ